MIKRSCLIGLCLVLTTFTYGQYKDNALLFLSHLTQHQGDSAYAMLDTSVQRKITPYALGQLWDNISSQYGQLKDTSGILYSDWSGNEVFIGLSFEQAELDLLVHFTNQASITGFYFRSPIKKTPFISADYVDTATFRNEKMVLENGKYKLPGLLSIPKSASKRYPLVILVHGSGPNSYKETLGPNEVFTDLAEGLASAGIAVFRYDKRTLRYGAAAAIHPDSITVWEECINDALFAIDSLSQHPQIDTTNIFVLGHSLGAYLGPRIAAHSKKIKGLILAAAPARHLEDILIDQYEFLDSLDPSGSMLQPLKEMRKAVAEVKDEDLNTETPSAYLPLNLPAKYWLDLRAYEPVELAKSLNCHILIAQGGRDYQVTLKDYEHWKSIADKSTVHYRFYPNLGHGFFEGGSEPGPEQYNTPDHVSIKFLQDILHFIQTP